MRMVLGAAVIALREGIEAALIIAIMLSYLKKTNRMRFRSYVIIGAVLAIVASIIVGLMLGVIWSLFEGEALALFEGIMVLTAAVLLTTMILWMWQLGSEISTEIRQSIEDKSKSQGVIGLLLLSFALIMREGVELVLFTIALSIQDVGQTIVGTLIGLGGAIIVGVLIYQGSLKMKLSSFFKWSSVFLVLFAAGMVAYGIHEIQEAGLLLIGPLEIWNLNPPVGVDGTYPLLHENGLIGGLLKALFGYNGNPSALEVAAYIGYLLIVAVHYFRKKVNTSGTELSEGT